MFDLLNSGLILFCKRSFNPILNTNFHSEIQFNLFVCFAYLPGSSAVKKPRWLEVGLDRPATIKHFAIVCVGMRRSKLQKLFHSVITIET